MRTREELEEDWTERLKRGLSLDSLLLETLLDIRDLLTKDK